MSSSEAGGDGFGCFGAKSEAQAQKVGGSDIWKVSFRKVPSTRKEPSRVPSRKLSAHNLSLPISPGNLKRTALLMVLTENACLIRHDKRPQCLPLIAAHQSKILQAI